MTIEETMDLMKRRECPFEVDVVDGVMAEVSQHPYMRRRHNVVWRWAAAAAVAAVAVVGVERFASVSSGFSSSDYELGSTMASLNDYSSWCAVEDAAVDPYYRYLYDEDIDD